MLSVGALAVASAGIKGCNSFSSQLIRESAPVPRLTLHEFLSSPQYKTPVLIRDIAAPETVESLADDVIGILGQEDVQLQRKIIDEDDGSRSTEVYDVALEDCIEYMMDSCHEESYFAFCEGLLPGSTPGSCKLSEKFNDIREAPFCNQENWFDYFPSKIKPTDAIILAGAGATSTLHRDPFEWTGTSLCIEGTKIWRFVVPPPGSNGGVAVVDEAFQSYRLDSIAWEEDDHDNSNEQIVLSAGWQSDMTLYETIDDSFPSGFEWATLEEDDDDEYQRQMEDMSSISCIQPNADAMIALDQIAKANGSAGRSAAPLFHTAIQQPGDLLLIPAHCWHQTYAPVPSVAVASQRCGANIDGANVIKHVLDVVNGQKDAPDILKNNAYTEGSGKDVVAKMIEYVT